MGKSAVKGMDKEIKKILKGINRANSNKFSIGDIIECIEDTGKVKSSVIKGTRYKVNVIDANGNLGISTLDGKNISSRVKAWRFKKVEQLSGRTRREGDIVVCVSTDDTLLTYGNIYRIENIYHRGTICTLSDEYGKPLESYDSNGDITRPEYSVLRFMNVNRFPNTENNNVNNFKIGDEVICMKNGEERNRIIEGEVYIIDMILNNGCLVKLKNGKDELIKYPCSLDWFEKSDNSPIFKAGDKVRCIDDVGTSLTTGDTFIVSDIMIDNKDKVCVENDSHKPTMYSASIFEKVTPCPFNEGDHIKCISNEGFEKYLTVGAYYKVNFVSMDEEIILINLPANTNIIGIKFPHELFELSATSKEVEIWDYIKRNKSNRFESFKEEDKPQNPSDQNTCNSTMEDAGCYANLGQPYSFGNFIPNNLWCKPRFNSYSNLAVGPFTPFTQNTNEDLTLFDAIVVQSHEINKANSEAYKKAYTSKNPYDITAAAKCINITPVAANWLYQLALSCHLDMEKHFKIIDIAKLFDIDKLCGVN